MGKKKQIKLSWAPKDYVPSDSIKVQQDLDEVAHMKKLANEGMLFDYSGVQIKRFDDNSLGWIATYEDGSEAIYRITPEGKPMRMKRYKDAFLTDTTQDRFERLIGITDEMRYTVSNKIDMIHALAFLAGATILGGIGALIALGIRSLIS